MRAIILSILSIASISTLKAQIMDLPRTNIVVADMKYNNGLFLFDNLQMVSAEKDCYENQPRFTTDGDYVLFSKEFRKKGKKRQPDEVTTDICTYKVNGGRVKRLTATPDYEFSPQESEYREQISAVQLDIENEDEQYIVKYNDYGKFERDEKLNGEQVGYYTWVNNENVLIYALPDPAHLKWVNLVTDEEILLASNIGRTIEYCKRDNGIYYVDKSGEDWYIKRIYVSNLNGEPEKVIQLFPDVEDFAMLNDGSMIICYQGKLYHFAPGKMGEYNGIEMENWDLIADLDRLEMPTKVSRLTINPENNMIVMVVDEDDEWFQEKH